MQRASEQVRPDSDRTIDSPRLLDGLGSRRRLAETARRAAQLLHHVRGKQLYDLELPKKVSRAGLGLPGLRLHALVPPLRCRH